MSDALVINKTLLHCLIKSKHTETNDTLIYVTELPSIHDNGWESITPHLHIQGQDSERTTGIRRLARSRQTGLENQRFLQCMADTMFH